VFVKTTQNGLGAATLNLTSQDAGKAPMQVSERQSEGHRAHGFTGKSSREL